MKKFFLAGAAFLLFAASLGCQMFSGFTDDEVSGAAEEAAGFFRGDSVNTEARASAEAAGEQSSNDALAEGIAAIVAGDATEYAVYIDYPQEGNSEYVYNSHAMRSASMIKVFILGAAMEKVRAGELSLSQSLILRDCDKVGGAGVLGGYASGTELTLSEVLSLMITESDNTATNMVIDLLGMAAINAYIQQNGYGDTLLQRKMMDGAAIAEGRENYTSAADLGHFFQRVYHHVCVGAGEDEIMLSYLRGQKDTECFPAALPSAVIAHKTGELVGLYDDGGIIYTGTRDVILVVMTENYSGRDRAIGTIREIARYAAAY